LGRKSFPTKAISSTKSLIIFCTVQDFTLDSTYAYSASKYSRRMLIMTSSKRGGPLLRKVEVAVQLILGCTDVSSLMMQIYSKLSDIVSKMTSASGEYTQWVVLRLNNSLVLA
jgi:hypothetical protein